MSVGLKIAVTGDALASVVRARLVLAPEAIRPVIGRAGSNAVRSHLFGLNSTRANHLGGRRTNFFSSAGRSTSFKVEGDLVVVSVAQIGIRQRYFGGTIKPKKAGGFLTIPVAPEAYGKRAREFSNLEIVFGKNGEPIALATKATAATADTVSKRGKVIPGQGARLGQIMFRLVRKVTQRPDPTILPSPEVIGAAVKVAVDDSFKRAVRRADQKTS